MPRPHPPSPHAPHELGGDHGSDSAAQDRSFQDRSLQGRSLLAYFGLTFALAIPFWVAGALTNFQLLPAIPVSALGLLGIVGAASILVYRENGLAGVAALLKRSFDFKRVKAKIWYAPTLLLMPCIMLLSYVVMRFMGILLPVPQFSFATTISLFAVLFIALRM